MLIFIQQAVKKTMSIKDATGKAMDAVEVFGACIRFLSDHLYDRVKQSIPESKKEDIRYVLTVPAIWNEGAKLFMKEAAKKVIIEENILVLYRIKRQIMVAILPF